jgi:Predicted membrane protein
VSYSDAELWAMIAAIGAGTFLIRYSFFGLIGRRELSPFVLRLLRYTPVAILPGLVAPLVLWPEATGGETDPARLLAAAATLGTGWATKNVLAAILAGGAVLGLAVTLV